MLSPNYHLASVQVTDGESERNSCSQRNTTHVSQFVFAPSVERVLADLHHLPEEHVPDLREPSAGGLHQGLQDGAGVRLHVRP